MTTGSDAEHIQLIERLNKLTARFSHMQDLDSLAREVQKVIDSVTECEYSGLYLLDPVSQLFKLPVAKGFTEAERLEAERTAMDRHPGRVVRERKVIHVADTLVDTSTQSSRRGFVVRSRLWLPVMSRGECVGAFGLASSRPNTFTEEHIALLRYVSNLAGLVYRNLTDSDALKLARDQARAGEQAKTRFLANVSHELRTPMNGVIGMTQLLLESSLTKEQREQAQVVQRSAKDLMEMVEDLLDYGRIEEGKTELEARPFRLETLLTDTVAVLHKAVEAKKVELSWAIEPDVPVVLVGDAGRIRRVLINLVSNAVKFTDVGHVQVRVARESSPSAVDGPSVKLRISVEDTGIGIAEELQERLFQRFTQADNTTSRRYGGTGLGLSIALSLTRLMGGDLVLDWSTPDVGSCFVATMVLGVGRSELAAPAPRVAEKGLRRVLVVDDNPVNRQVATMLCERLGVAALSADDGVTALETLRQTRIDLVLMDIHMPGMDGITATSQIRKLTESATLATVPVVALSADQLPQTRRRSFSAGVDAYYTKPLTLSHLQEILDRYDVLQPPVRLSAPVLVVDDSPVNRMVLVKLLEARGLEAIAVEDGQSAVVRASEERFSMIIVDLHMPELDGIQTLQQMRACGLNTVTPVFVCTGDTGPEVRAACLEAGATGVLLKPIRTESLDAILATAGV